jgi:hypothetical protein
MPGHPATRLIRPRAGRGRAIHRVAASRRVTRTRLRGGIRTSRKRLAFRRPRHGGPVLTAGVAVLLTAASVTVVVESRGGPPPPPKFISPAQADFLAGSHGRFTIRTANFAGMLTEQGILPAGLALHDGASGAAVISGIPTDGSGGAYLVTLSAADPGHTPVRQMLALIVDQSPTLTASSTSQRGLASHYLTFRLVATGYPVPRITLTGKLPPALRFISQPGAAIIAGHLTFSWLKAIVVALMGIASIVVTALTDGSPLIVELVVGAGTSASDNEVGHLLYTSPNVAAMASNGVGKPSKLILTIHIFGPN